MTYQALARKWRPRDFSQLVGQEHVVNALSYALKTNQVHHAFLLTGTRGVGKTTIARILAKCLNCQTNGISAAPCNECNNCQAVDEGQFIDLIEVDAASRTRVDDTRELLENVQYSPTHGEYKIYLIDEVHMLSGHSFNALLKTLEEPPAHVKFVLATTEPEKLPITILSRCIQFYLKLLSVEQINGQLKLILDDEKISYQSQALIQLANSAKGSMRDALSLLDQAIALGGGQVKQNNVQNMLGLVDDNFIQKILEALAQNNIDSILSTTAKVTEKGVDYINLLDELLRSLHRLSLLKFSDKLDDLEKESEIALDKLSKFFSKETLQLYYQIALLGKRDIYLAASMQSGMEMILLRMLAFTPESEKGNSDDNTPSASFDAAEVKKNNNDQLDQTLPKLAIQTVDAKEERNNKKNTLSMDDFTVENWPNVANDLNATGFAKELLLNCVLIESKDDRINLAIDESNIFLINDNRVNQINKLINQKLQTPVEVKIQPQAINQQTPSQINKQQHAAKIASAEKIIMNDPPIKDLIDTMQASIIPGSTKVH